MNKFLTQTIKYPTLTGAVAPSSAKLSRLITNSANLQSAKFVVELGPGTGVFTQEIIKQIPNLDKYIGIEINNEFHTQLKQMFPNLTIHKNSVENIRQILNEQSIVSVDRIISGIPWTAFNSQKQQSIMKEVYEVLEPNGLFLTFAYSPLNHLKNGRNFRQLLNKTFTKVTQTKLVANLPLAFVYICRK